MEHNSELELEQRHVDRAYACLQAARERAIQLRSMVQVSITGGTSQARVEADAIEKNIRQRLLSLRLGFSKSRWSHIKRRHCNRSY